jgi:hypothetical protein
MSRPMPATPLASAAPDLRKRRAASAPRQLLASIPAMIFLGGFAVAYAYAALGAFNHNDNLAAVAPAVMRHAAPYSGFAFDQTPLSLLLFHQLEWLIGDRHLYTALRVLSLGLNLASVLVGVMICRHAAANKWFAAIIFAGLCLWFEPLEETGGEIGNYTLSLLFFSAALFIYFAAESKNKTGFFVGLLVGLAISTKANYAYPALAFYLIYGSSSRDRQAIWRYSIGLICGIAPCLYYAAVNFDNFVFFNIYAHYLQNIYRDGAFPAAHSGLFLFAIKSAALPVILLAAATAVATMTWLRVVAPPWRIRLETELLCLGVAALFGAVTPGIVFNKYLALPGFVLFLLVAVLSDRLLFRSRLAAAQRRQFAAMIVTVVVVLGVYRSIDLVTEAAKRSQDGVYGITAVARFRDTLDEAIAAIDAKHPGCHGALVTAAGAPAVGASATISPVSAAGPFIMRLDAVFAQLAPDYRRFSDVGRYLAPNSLILTGFYGDATYEPVSPFEKTMVDYAAGNGLVPIDLGSFMDRPMVLYVPAACLARV